jgi:hypothetical protein
MTILERVEAMLLTHDITPEHQGDDLTTYIACGMVGCRMLISHTKGMLRVYITQPVHVPDYQRQAVADAIARVNWSLHSGAMELDMSDGELRFRNVLPVMDSDPTDEQLDWVLFWSWSLMGRYTNALLDVIVGACEPETAIAKVEAPGLEMVSASRGGLPN